MSTISGYVFADLDADGIHDCNEGGMDDATIQLLDVNNNENIINSTVTNSDGFYQFSGINPGTYLIKEKQPTGCFDGLESIGNTTVFKANETLFDRILITVTGSDCNSYNFAEIPCGSISGYVYHDSNGNGTKDDGENGIANVQMKLINSSGLTIKTVISDSNGFYKFNGLAVNTYTIQEIQPYGYNDGQESINNVTISENGDKITPITLAVGQHSSYYNFGELASVAPQLTSLEGYVYKAVNDNGTKEKGETGISGAIISLKNSSNGSLIAQTVTDIDGKYLFAGLNPNITYTLSETQPSGYTDGLDGYDSTGCVSFTGYVNGVTFGSSITTAKRNIDQITGITIGAGQTAGDFNFGEIEIPLMLNRSRISGRIFLDINQNNTVGDVSGEVYLAGQRVMLYQNGRAITYANTDAQGFYLFNNLNPGSYQLRQVSSVNYLDGQEYLGTGAVTASLGGNDIFNISVIANARCENFNFSER